MYLPLDPLMSFIDPAILLGRFQNARAVVYIYNNIGRSNFF